LPVFICEDKLNTDFSQTLSSKNGVF
jgi:hypothetical protein